MGSATARRAAWQQPAIVMQYWVPTVLYAGVIFYLSSIQHPEQLLPISIWDKFAHVLEYAVLGVLCYRAFLHASSPSTARRALLLAVVTAGIYGISDELHQLVVPLRETDVLDVLADGLGATLGAWGWAYGRSNVPWMRRGPVRRYSG
jgi:VanZ family protein